MNAIKRFSQFSRRHRWYFLAASILFVYFTFTGYVMLFTWLSPILYPALIILVFMTVAAFLGKYVASICLVAFAYVAVMDFRQVALWRSQHCDDLVFYSSIGDELFNRNIHISNIEDCEVLCQHLMYRSFPSMTLDKDVFAQVFSIPAVSTSRSEEGVIKLELTLNPEKCQTHSLQENEFFRLSGDIQFCLVWTELPNVPDGTLAASVSVTQKNFWASTYSHEQRVFRVLDGAEVARFEAFDLETKSVLPMHRVLMFPSSCPRFGLNTYFIRTITDKERITL